MIYMILSLSEKEFASISEEDNFLKKQFTP